MKNKVLLIATVTSMLSFNALGQDSHSGDHPLVDDHLIAEQRSRLAQSTRGAGFGPQSPRNIDSVSGNNPVTFSVAPPHTQMNLCNIHFHKNAEHAGGEFTQYAGNGDGQGYLSGYRYSGQLSNAELAPVAESVCPSEHGSLLAGDTIEVHYVYSSAQVAPGPTLNACFSDSSSNPQLRVEAQVFVVVNDNNSRDFITLTQYERVNGLYQALNLPTDTGLAVQYAGPTTGPGFNEVGSPFQVSWGVRPEVAKVNAVTVGQWCKANVFNEDHGHGVRNLVTNPDLLSPIR